MTSRDQLEELAKRLKWLNDHAPNYSPGLMSSWIDNVRPELEKAAAAIRELLAQEPVGTIGEENFTLHVMVGLTGWHTLPSPRSVPIMFKVLPAGTPLYAAPVPAVDLEAFKAEAMRLADEWKNARGRHAQRTARPALTAHLDKLGEK